MLQDLLAGLEDDGGKILRVYQIYDWGAANTRTDLFKPMICSLIARKVQSKEGTAGLSIEKKAAMTRAWRKAGVVLPPDGWLESASNYNTAKILLNSVPTPSLSHPCPLSVSFLLSAFDLGQDVRTDHFRRSQVLLQLG